MCHVYRVPAVCVTRERTGRGVELEESCVTGDHECDSVRWTVISLRVIYSTQNIRISAVGRRVIKTIYIVKLTFAAARERPS